jgi:hypothetical protein
MPIIDARPTPPSLSIVIKNKQIQRKSLQNALFATCRIEQGLLLSTRHGAETLAEKDEEAANGSDSAYARTGIVLNGGVPR